MTVELRRWETAAYLGTQEARALYLNACLEEAGDDAEFIAKALSDIARARGMTQLAEETQLDLESLGTALAGDGDPSFAAILKVVNALGLRLHATALQDSIISRKES